MFHIFFDGAIKVKTLLSFILMLLLSILTISSGGNSNSEPESTVINDLLPGNIADKAITRNIVHDDSQRIETSDFVIAADGRHVTLARLKTWLENNASAGEDNRVLQATSPQIISKIPRVLLLSQVVDRPADFQVLHTPKNQLLKSSGFQSSTNHALRNGDIANEY